MTFHVKSLTEINSTLHILVVALHLCPCLLFPRFFSISPRGTNSMLFWQPHQTCAGPFMLSEATFGGISTSNLLLTPGQNLIGSPQGEVQLIFFLQCVIADHQDDRSGMSQPALCKALMLLKINWVGQRKMLVFQLSELQDIFNRICCRT